MKKSFLIFLVLFVVCLGVNSAYALKNYSDVYEDDPYYVAIQYLSLDDVGVFEGYSDGTFRAENFINRAELMKVLVESVYGTPDEDEYRDCYTDVADEWYAKYVCYATEQGWVSGYPDGTFLPANNVLKVEALKMMLNVNGFSDELPDDVSGQIYADTDNTQWYAPYVYLAKQYNLLEEIGAYYGPSDEMSRGAVSEVLFRIYAVLNLDSAVYSSEEREVLLESFGLADLISSKKLIIADSYEIDDDGVIYVSSYHEDEDGVFSLQSFADVAGLVVADSYSVSSGVIEVGEYILDDDEYVNLSEYQDRDDEFLVVLVVRENDDGETFKAIDFDQIQSQENPVPEEPAEAFLGTLAATNSAGRTGSYYLPYGYNLGEMPLLVLYHGTGGDGLGMLQYFLELADLYGFIIVAPDSRVSPYGDYTWEVGLSEGDISEDYTHTTNCINEVASIADVSIDEDFIMSAGFSGGASSAPYYATNTPEFTHFAILHGGVFISGLGDNIVPGWLSTGEDDTLRTPEMFETYVADLENAGYTDLTYNVYPGGHELTDAELEELVGWWLEGR